MQQIQGTMISPGLGLAGFRPRLRALDAGIARVQPLPMTILKPRQVFIQGITQDGRTFRPSDWSERLAGAMSSFRPGGTQGGIGAFIGYSPYCVPRVINGVKCVIVSEALKDVEPMAWDFVMNFATDNGLQVTDACLLTEDKPSAG
jgi:Protein of unknown function (DUF3579)